MSTKDLLEHQARNRDRTAELVENAKATIKREIEEHGYYPENNGRVTVKELCKRAGVGYSTLKNPAHKTTLKKVRDWLARLKIVAPTAKADADVIKRERAKGLIEQIEIIGNKFNFFKIDYDKLLEKVGALEDRNTDLEAKNAKLERENAALVRRVAELERGPAKGGETNVIHFPRSDDPAP